MKKIISILLIVLCACGCALRQTQEYHVDEIITHDNRSETIGQSFRTEVVWIVEPCMVMDAVEELAAEAPLGYPALEKVGHPQEWDYMAGKGPFIVDSAEYIGAPVYTSNAILAVHEGICDYDGNLLNRKGSSLYCSEAGFDQGNPDSKLFDIYSSDFIGTIKRNGIAGLSKGNLGLFEYKGVLYSAVADYGNIEREILSFSEDLQKKEIDIEKDLEYRKATADDLFGHRAAVPVLNKVVSKDGVYDTAIYDEKGNRLFVFANTEDTREVDFTNGFLTVQTVPENGGTAEIRYAFYSVDAQEYITEFAYEEAKPFVEGYAAVRKDGKWAYINEKGEAVTDFIWDDVSTMYDGRVYVGLKDRFGILDLKGTLAKGSKVTLESCYGSSDPQMAYTAASALERHVPKQVERDPAAVAAEEEYEKAQQIIGVITPRFDDINVREQPNTDAKIVDVLRNKGTEEEEFYYSQYVYDVTEADGYTWYRIGTDRWVADHGNWYEVELFGE